MEFEKGLITCRLIDVYGEMLTKKQQEIMHNYFFENLTLSEIAELRNISKQAVDFTIKNSLKIVEKFEEKLRCVQKFDSITSLLDKEKNDNNSMIFEKIKEILNS